MKSSAAIINKTAVALKKSSQPTRSSSLSTYQEALQLIESMFQMRFIEKISSPISKAEKGALVEKFAGKLENLHIKLQMVREEVFLQTKLERVRDSKKKAIQSTTDRPLDCNQAIRKIESKYTEVFYEGSFKFYKRIKMINHFSQDLDLINIQEWSNSCLSRSQPQSDCC